MVGGVPPQFIREDTRIKELHQMPEYGIDAIFVLMGLPSATLAWYKQPPAMRVCIKSYTKKSPIVLQ